MVEFLSWFNTSEGWIYSFVLNLFIHKQRIGQDNVVSFNPSSFIFILMLSRQVVPLVFVWKGKGGKDATYLRVYTAYRKTVAFELDIINSAQLSCEVNLYGIPVLPWSSDFQSFNSRESWLYWMNEWMNGIELGALLNNYRIPMLINGI